MSTVSSTLRPLWQTAQTIAKSNPAQAVAHVIEASSADEAKTAVETLAKQLKTLHQETSVLLMPAEHGINKSAILVSGPGHRELFDKYKSDPVGMLADAWGSMLQRQFHPVQTKNGHILETNIQTIENAVSSGHTKAGTQINQFA